MNRTVGTFLLLTSVSGCLSFNPDPIGEVSERPARAQAVPSPAVPTWSENGNLPSRYQTAGARSATYPTGYQTTASARPLAATGTRPAGYPVVMDSSGHVRQVASASATPPATLPPAMPPATRPDPVQMVSLPPGARTEPTAVQANYTTTEPGREPVVQARKVESPTATKKGPELGLPDVTGAKTPGGFAAAKEKPMVPVDKKSTKGRRSPMMRMVNSKRITLNFQVNDVGPSGISGVELWYTQDCKEWKKHEAPPQAHSYIIEVEEEGMYGFTLLARSGLGLAKDPPSPGDLPQVWVLVDLTKPAVKDLQVEPSINEKVQRVAFKWKAADKNLCAQPITLSYAAQENGPWTTIAANLENTGRYVWQVPPGAPPRFFVRVEATDLAGNIGTAASPRALLLDASRPEVSILDVESTGR